MSRVISFIKKLFFTTHNAQQVVFKNFVWLGVSQMGSRIIRAFITFYAARALGAAGYGVFSYAMGLAGFFIFFKNIGIDSIMTRDIAREPHAREKIFSTGLWMEAILLIITAGVILFVAPLFSRMPGAIVLLPAIAVMLVADDLRDFFIAFFRGVEKMEWEAVVVTLGNVCVTAFGFIALWRAPTPLSLAVAYAVASVFVTLVSGSVIVWRYGTGVVRMFSRERVFPILSAAWPIAIAALPSVFLFNVDLVMLGWWWPAETVGIYAAGQKVVGIAAIVPQLVATSTFPLFARMASERNVNEARAITEHALRIMFAFGAPLVIGGAVLSAPLLARIFGDAYASGSVAFAILLGTTFATFPIMILSNVVFAYNAQRKTIFYSFFAAATNVAVNAVLVPRYGMIGASCATVVSFGIYALLLFRSVRKIFPLVLYPNPLKIFCAAAAMGVLAFMLDKLGVDVFVTIGISAICYGLILSLLKDDTVMQLFGFLKK